MLRIQRFDPGAFDFPAPRVPVLAPMTARFLSFRSNDSRASVHWYRRGRYALKEAYRRSGVGPAKALLAPSYHCRSMLDPAVALGARVALYPVQPDLSPDLHALPAIVEAVGEPVGAMVLSHYFGFPQDLQAAAAFCASRNIALVEDCSHVFIGNDPSAAGATARIGTTGRYAVASPYKFFPSNDGGLLWSNGVAMDAPAARSPGFVAEIKGAAELLRQLLKRRPTLEVARIDDEIALAERRSDTPPSERTDAEATPSALYDPGEEELASLTSSRWIVRRTDLAQVAARRRGNYLRWLEAMSGLSGCRPLYRELPEGCVPYMFPLRIERPHDDFFVLKRLGMPIWRWDEMAASGCEVARRYRLNLLHLPCHQALSSNEMQWMTTVVAKVCGRSHRLGASRAD